MGLLPDTKKIAGAHAPGMLGTFSPSPQVSDPDMHHGTCVTHVPWCMPGSLTSGFLWNRQRGKRSRHSRRMRNLQFYVSGKRPMGVTIYFTEKTIGRGYSFEHWFYICVSQVKEAPGGNSPINNVCKWRLKRNNVSTYFRLAQMIKQCVTQL